MEIFIYLFLFSCWFVGIGGIVAVFLIVRTKSPEKEIIPNQSIVSFEYNDQLFLGTILSYKHPYYTINAHTGFYEKSYTQIELHHNRIRKIIAKA
jgi:hypothetical protein